MSEYQIKSELAEEFIHHETIEETMAKAKMLSEDKGYIQSLLEKAMQFHGLTPLEACTLTHVKDTAVLDTIFSAAKKVKEHIYGKRIVMFAPLYLSNYCVNGCTYCAYHQSSCIVRKKLNKEELIREVEALEAMGHKRLALETGEDPVNCPLEYVLDCIKTIYEVKPKSGRMSDAIRRVNVNIAATTVEDYKRLKAAGIGTYILFQETYHKPTYERLHPTGPKHNYQWHTTAHDRAMQAGIDDVGIGVLFGLYDWRYEMTAMLMYVNHLEAVFGVGPHTISVPRIREAANVNQSDFPYLMSDDDFKKLVAILRLSVPYTGMILSTREAPEFRDEVINLGISQVSGGSCTGVGGYASENRMREDGQKPQFEVSDHRTAQEVLQSLMDHGYIPSFCTACYREGRTGDRFMRLAKTGQIGNVCQANALLTLNEYALDYGDEAFKRSAKRLISEQVETIPNKTVQSKVKEYLEEMNHGKCDFRF